MKTNHQLSHHKELYQAQKKLAQQQLLLVAMDFHPKQSISAKEGAELIEESPFTSAVLLRELHHHGIARKISGGRWTRYARA